MARKSVSVLMSTYSGDKLSYLENSISSIINQLYPPNEFIIVIDGEIPQVNRDYLYSISGTVNEITIKIVPIAKIGLAGALNAGLEQCTSNWIARMDSDDISLNDRLLKQFEYLEGHNEIDLLATWHEEFREDDSNFKRIKKCPEWHNEIKKTLRYRNCISHPSILIKTSLEQIGGYSEDIVPFEDYDLYYRLIADGFVLACLQEPLVKVRVTGQVQRRSGLKNLKIDFKLKYRAYKRGNYNFITFLLSLMLLSTFRLLPIHLKNLVYSRLRES